jgi:hypothetical protein
LPKYIPVFFFILNLLAGKANGENFPDSSQCRLSIAANYHYGFIIAHRSSIVPLQQDHVKGLELSISTPTTGSKVWQREYNYPVIGLKYFFINTGNPEMLGNAQAVLPFIDFNFSKNHNAEFHFSYGWGIGYIDNPFNRETNYKNIAIGSHWNAVVNLSSYYKIKLFKTTFLTGGLNFIHFSNGSAAIPNLGINIVTVKAGLSCNFGGGKPMMKDSLPVFNKHFRNSIYVAGGVKQIYPVDGPDYYTVTLSAARLRQFTRKSAFGFGADLHYDNSLAPKLLGDSILTKKLKDEMRAGINASYELIFSDFSMMFQMGGYIYNPYKPEGFIYQRLGFRYLFYKNIFTCFNLKTHWAKADFFELGFGVKL